MIQIHKVKDEKTIKKLATDSDIEYNENVGCVAVFENEQIIEYLLYTEQKTAYNINYISNQTGDFELILGVIKTLLFLADLGKIESINLQKNYDRVAKAIGFEQDEDFYILKLKDYHKKCCC